MTPAERRAQAETQWKTIAEALGAEKLKKFQEIYFQASVPATRPNAPAGAPAPVMGLNVFILGTLDLTADQKEKINNITDGLTQQRGATQEDRAAFQAARTKANDDIKAVLTDAQKKKMDELTAGAPALREKLGLGQGGPGGAQGGGQRGQGGGQGGTPAGPGAGSWQPGQAAPGGAGGGGNRGNRGGGFGGGGN
jgi:Spy/CpxP family protein refolding chaperone